MLKLCVFTSSLTERAAKKLSMMTDLLVHEDRFKSGRNQRMFVSTPSVDESLFRFPSHRMDVLDGVLRHIVLGRTQTHHWSVAGARHWRLA